MHINLFKKTYNLFEIISVFVEMVEYESNTTVELEEDVTFNFIHSGRKDFVK